MSQHQHRIAAAAFSLLLSASVLHSEEQIKLTPVMNALSSTTISGYVDTSAIYRPGGLVSSDYYEVDQEVAPETAPFPELEDVSQISYFTGGVSISIGFGTTFNHQVDNAQQLAELSQPFIRDTFIFDQAPQADFSQTSVPEPSSVTFAFVMGMLALPFVWRKRFQPTAL